MELEDMHHFEIGGNVDEGSADISLTCLRCPEDTTQWIAVSSTEDGPVVTLADLFLLADAHLDRAHI